MLPCKQKRNKQRIYTLFDLNIQLYQTYHEFKQNKWECCVAHHDACCDAGKNVVKHARKLCALEAMPEHATCGTRCRHH